MPVHSFVCAMALVITILGLSAHYGRDFYHYGLYAMTDLSFSDNKRRVALIRQSVANPSSLEDMTAKDFDLLFRSAEITRKEANVTARHYQSGTCAINVYFRGQNDTPDYVEFRVLSLNDEVQSKFEGTEVNLSCLKDVLEARGVSTPEHYAAQPVPSWASPYRS